MNANGLAEKKKRVYRIDPSCYITARKEILSELVREAGLTDEDVNKLFEELNSEPWPDDPGILDAVIDKVADMLGVTIRYEFPQ